MATAILTYKEPGLVLPLRLPVSKSIASRLMLMAALGGYDPRTLLSSGSSHLCTDLKVMLQAAGLIYSVPSDGFIELDIRDSGTAKRLLTAVLASIEGVDAILHMSERLAQRPLGPLLEMLSHYGAGTVRRHNNSLIIKGRRPAGDTSEIRVSPSVSSQVFTAIMFVGALSEKGISVLLEGMQPSSSYIEMTASLMRDCGVNALFDAAHLQMQVSPGRFILPPRSLMEPDWSAASYIYLHALLSGKELYIEGLCASGHSLQGDAACASLFSLLGVDTVVESAGVRIVPGKTHKCDRLDISLANTPDLLPALAVACAMTQTPFRFRGVSHLRHKESDRLEACRAEMAKYGITLTIGPDDLRMDNAVCPKQPREIIKTYSDHRIAMSFAQTAILFQTIEMEDPDCADKSFPGFREQMDLLGITIDKDNTR